MLIIVLFWGFFFCLLSTQIVFEGIRGSSFEGDIAIDDVSITTGKCKQENTVASAGKTGKIERRDVKIGSLCRDVSGHRTAVGEGRHDGSNLKRSGVSVVISSLFLQTHSTRINICLILVRILETNIAKNHYSRLILSCPGTYWHLVSQGHIVNSCLTIRPFPSLLILLCASFIW